MKTVERPRSDGNDTGSRAVKHGDRSARTVGHNRSSPAFKTGFHESEFRKPASNSFRHQFESGGHILLILGVA